MPYTNLIDSGWSSRGCLCQGSSRDGQLPRILKIFSRRIVWDLHCQIAFRGFSSLSQVLYYILHPGSMTNSTIVCTRLDLDQGYVCVCMYVCAYTCIHVWLYITVYTLTPTYKQAYLHACMHANIIHAYRRTDRQTDGRTDWRDGDWQTKVQTLWISEALELETLYEP